MTLNRTALVLKAGHGMVMCMEWLLYIRRGCGSTSG